ncbi:uncharacterized protein [Arachis hypogaea]|uniref:uncharacterized protein n=2 Tax=Arachis TaxID=3817 RepID=UPI000DEDB403
MASKSNKEKCGGYCCVPELEPPPANAGPVALTSSPLSSSIVSGSTSSSSASPKTPSPTPTGGTPSKAFGRISKDPTSSPTPSFRSTAKDGEATSWTAGSYTGTEEEAMAALELEPAAVATLVEIGAISYMIKRLQDGKLLGYNVDYLGAITAIEKGLTDRRLNETVVLGVPVKATIKEFPNLSILYEIISWLPFPPGSQKITEIIKKRYDKPYKKFGDVPLLTKKLWFKEWKSHFLIDDDDEEFFWKAFKYRTSKRFSQMMSDIREGVDTTHEWLIPAYKKVLEKYWETDEKWKNIRKKARENRASLLGGSVHCGGSIPLSSTIERMKKQLDRTPTHEEVFKETHTLKSDKSKWVDKRSQDTHEKFIKKLAEVQAQHVEAQAQGMELPPIDEDLIWEEVCGGQKKNRVYGKGAFFSSSIKSRTTSANSVSGRASTNQNSVPDL